MAVTHALQEHLDSGATTLCRAWSVVRKDGLTFGFTDHDCALAFDDITFQAQNGMTAQALQSSNGLSVDNSEVLGVLSADAIREADIENGLLDDATVTAWMVNWSEPSQRHVIFKGAIGEITRSGGAFRAELRGVAEELNQPVGRVFQKGCDAQLGDIRCGVDVEAAAFSSAGVVSSIDEGGLISVTGLSDFDDAWFRRGVLEIADGTAGGAIFSIKSDSRVGESRVIGAWSTLPQSLAVGDTVRLTAGCDKRFATCQSKFANTLNFRGFPDVPEEDWVLVHPSARGETEGGSRR